MKKLLAILLNVLLLLSLVTACGGQQNDTSVDQDNENQVIVSNPVTSVEPEGPNIAEEDPIEGEELTIPEFSGSPYFVLNGNVPFFEEWEKTTEVFEEFDELDRLGRCGVTYANVCRELMPTGDRESISHIYPSGWEQNMYDFVDGNALYNRCHLLGFQLTGENANERNLITGTRYLNVQGMLPFENLVADYVKETDNHVLYRVTPVFDGDNLVASGVIMEAWSVEDEGEGVCFCVYCYNVQPGVSINYATGENWEGNDVAEDVGGNDNDNDKFVEEDTEEDYVLNVNSKKFHNPDCSGAEKISEKNRQDYHGSRQQLIDEGYEPCGICNP